jgi:hypothetical protein
MNTALCKSPPKNVERGTMEAEVEIWLGKGMRQFFTFFKMRELTVFRYKETYQKLVRCKISGGLVYEMRGQWIPGYL